jgi:hypothetical protein
MGSRERQRRKFKIRLPTNSKLVLILASLLASIFLAAQLHCCVDLNSQTMDSHACPVCCTVGAAIATCALILAITPAINRLEILLFVPPFLLVIFRTVTPRAPPLA